MFMARETMQSKNKNMKGNIDGGYGLSICIAESETTTKATAAQRMVPLRITRTCSQKDHHFPLRNILPYFTTFHT